MTFEKHTKPSEILKRLEINHVRCEPHTLDLPLMKVFGPKSNIATEIKDIIKKKALS